MRTLFTDFRVGLFVLLAVGIVVFGYFWTYDGVARGEAAYRLHLTVPDATGMWKGTPVDLAGIEIGSIGTLDVAGGHAELEMLIRSRYELPVDSHAEIRSTGMLGDRYIAMIPGESEKLLKDGDTVKLGKPPADLGKIQADAQSITSDLKVVAKTLREVAENDDNKKALEATLQNVQALSGELRTLTERNADDIDRIVASIGQLTDHLQTVTDQTGTHLDDEMTKLKQATDTLQSALDDMHSVTGKVDRGEGTIGKLINDDSTIRSIDDTVGEVNKVVKGFSGLHADVYYEGRQYFGTQPTDPQFYYGNPLAGGASNTLGVRLMPSRDFWWRFAITSTPQGTVDWTETYVPETGSLSRAYERKPGYRFTLQMEKRWYDFSLRLGLKEGGGGVGASLYLLHDKVRLAADVFDFDLGSYPAVASEGLPNTRLDLRVEPLRHVYVNAGAEQILLGAKYHYFTGYVGVGFHFYDDDIKLLLATLPIGSATGN